MNDSVEFLVTLVNDEDDDSILQQNILYDGKQTIANFNEYQ